MEHFFLFYSSCVTHALVSGAACTMLVCYRSHYVSVLVLYQSFILYLWTDGHVL